MRDRTFRRLVICPCPPILLPGATGRETVPEAELLRGAMQDAADWLQEPGEPILVLAAGEHGHVPGGTRLSAAAYGLSYQGRLGVSDGPEHGNEWLTPHSPGLLIAAHLLDGHPATAVEVSDIATAHRVAKELQATSVLVCGGGSARRRDGAPGYIDPRAVPYDDQLVGRIGAADLSGLATPDSDLADELLSDVARPLAVAARLAVDGGVPVRAQVDSYCAPYGVANIVARWWTDD